MPTVWGPSEHNLPTTANICHLLGQDADVKKNRDSQNAGRMNRSQQPLAPLKKSETTAALNQQPASVSPTSRQPQFSTRSMTSASFLPGYNLCPAPLLLDSGWKREVVGKPGGSMQANLGFLFTFGIWQIQTLGKASIYCIYSWSITLLFWVGHQMKKWACV